MPDRTGLMGIARETRQRPRMEPRGEEMALGRGIGLAGGPKVPAMALNWQPLSRLRRIDLFTD